MDERWKEKNNKEERRKASNKVSSKVLIGSCVVAEKTGCKEGRKGYTAHQVWRDDHAW